MQVVSGGIDKTTVHFEAPPSGRVPEEMKQFFHWFEKSRSPMPPLLRASLCHIYFESIHPFEDGNGRMGRVLSELALSQSLNQPLLLALSRVIESQKSAYYAGLAEASRGLEVDDWIDLFSGMILQAQQESLAACRWLITKARFFENFRNQLNTRQEKVLLRLFEVGPDGFEGGLSAANYQNIAKSSPATTTRDLAELVRKSALTRTGSGRYSRYSLAVETAVLSTK